MMENFLWIVIFTVGITGLIYLLLLNQTLPRDRLIADLNSELAAYANIGARVKALEAAVDAQEAREWHPAWQAALQREAA